MTLNINYETNHFPNMGPMDLRLKCPFTMIICGPSNCGKTTFVSNLLQKSSLVYSQFPGKIYWFYKVKQKMDPVLEKMVDEFEEEMCTMDWILANSPPKNSTIIIDDMSLEATEDTAKLFSIASHHHKLNIIFISQNLFTKNAYFREISLNCTYVVLFKNVRDKLQISNFAKQFAPGKNKAFLSIFSTATKKPHSYLLLDNHQETPDQNRIISNYLFEDNKPISLWLLSDYKK